ncbi:hypothetical protein, partial [Pseudanabaena mucicola]
DNPLIRNDVTQISVSSDLNDSNSASSNYEQIQRFSNLSNKDTDLSIDPLRASNQQVQRQTDSLNSSDTSTITPVQTSNFELSEDIVEPQDISIIQREIDIAPIESTDTILSTASIDAIKDVTDIVNNNLPEIQRTSEESSSEAQTNETSLNNSNEIRQEQTSSFIDESSQNQLNTQDIQRKIESSASISTQHLPNQINQSNIDQTISSLSTNNIQPIQPSANNVSNFTNDSTEIIPKDSSIIAENDDLFHGSGADITEPSSVESIQRQLNLSESDNILQSNEVPQIQQQIQQQNDLSQQNVDLATNNVPELQRMSEDKPVTAQKIEQSSKVSLVQRFQDIAKSAIGNIFADRSSKEQQTTTPVAEPINPQIQRFDIQNQNTDSPDVDTATGIEPSIPNQILQRQSMNDDLSPINASNRESVLDNQDVQMQGQPENLTINPETITESSAVFSNIDIISSTISDPVQRQADIVNDTSQPQNNTLITFDRQEITTSSQDYQNSEYLENRSQTVSPIQREPDLSIENISEINQIDSLQRSSQSTSVNDISQPQNKSQMQSIDDSSTVDNLNNNNLNSNVDMGIEAINQSPTIQRKDNLVNLTAIDVDDVNGSIDQIEKSESVITTPTPNISTPDNVQSVQNVIQRSPQSSNEIDASSELDLGISENPKIIQMMTDPDRKTEDLQLPTAITNLAQTAYLGNFSTLTPSVPPQSVMRSQIDRPSPSNPTSSITNRIQAKSEPSTSNSNSNNSESNSMGWSNISELLANLPPTTSNTTTSSLNQQTNRDRSSLAIQRDLASINSSSQTTIQRATDKTNNTSDQELYLTPTGLQKENPNRANNLANVIQPARDYPQNDNLPQATVTVQRSQEQGGQSDQDEVNFDQNLEILAQEIYILLKKRLEIDKERQGGRYQGRLPW